jgi:hypothetical protein
MRVKIEDLPQHLQAQVRAQLAGDARTMAPEGRRSLPVLAPLSEPVQSPDRGAVVKRHRAPNKTEADYQRHYLRGVDARYEGLTFRMANGHRYTPDWVVFIDGRPVACHECKGGYALHSQQRARLAFDQVRVEFPWLRWIWAVRVGGQWTVNGDQCRCSN